MVEVRRGRSMAARWWEVLRGGGAVLETEQEQWAVVGSESRRDYNVGRSQGQRATASQRAQ